MIFEIWRGFDTVIQYTFREVPANCVTPAPLDLTDFVSFYADIDDKSGGADKGNIEGDLVDATTGRVDFVISRTTTLAWDEEVRWRIQFRAKDSSGKWFPAGGPDTLIVHGRVADDDAPGFE